jgi:radical SAM superfamily enzyme YgiQ (UPF0313 family)
MIEGGIMTTIALVSLISPMYKTANFNLGLAELAGYLRHKNPELDDKGIHFIEPDLLFARSNEDGNEYIIKELNRLRPDIIGISAKIGTVENLKNLLPMVKKMSWCPTIVVGNVVSTFSYDILAPMFPGVLFCIGDGELAMDAIYNDVDKYEVPNIAFIDCGILNITDRKILDYENQYWLPAFDSLSMATIQKADIAIRSTTGCSNHCTFCSIPNISVDGCGKRMGWRNFPIERTIRSLKYLALKGINMVYFADDEFGNVDWDFLKRMGNALNNTKNTIKFNVSMRLDAFYTPDMTKKESSNRLDILRSLKKGGLNSLFLGAESGCDSQLKRYGKGITRDIILNSLKILIKF